MMRADLASLPAFTMYDIVGIFEGYLSSYHLILTSEKAFLRRPCRSSESILREEKPIDRQNRQRDSESQGGGTKMATETGGVKQVKRT